MSEHPRRSRVVAVLGPTNTGKTYLAIERMLGHRSGMIGFPLRLLARENYDRIVKARGAAQVALITGEEKIIPPQARYFVCTVESMPLDRPVNFLAVDEIQLCADPDRGHVFTDRLLHARGLDETMLLGAETIRPLLRRLVPGAEFIARPRFSQLAHTEPRKLTRLAPRSAVVAFSAADVYSIAELVRRQRGGAAVVLGALSPRTRNAQVALYQSGEVDTLIATDAIGMGLNMDVDHVVFAARRKFDGRAPRDLTATEIAQIAGRAGRYMTDGTFATAADVEPMDAEMIERVESHVFPPLTGLFWRNDRLRTTSIDALLASLQAVPPKAGLIRARAADDQLVLEALARDADIRARADTPALVARLWEVCQVPDFRKVGPETHARLVGRIHGHLTGPGERLPEDWLAAQVARLERTDGDIDALVERIASIRIWTYVSHRPGWLDQPVHWQERTRAIEDGLSDALHERLIKRFVDRRTSVLVQRLRSADRMQAAVAGDGEVKVEGHFVGRLSGLRFEADAEADAPARRAVMAAAAKTLPLEIARRVRDIEADPDETFSLGDDGLIAWRGAPLASLGPGSEVLRPGVEPLASDLVDGALRERVRRRVADWLRHHVESGLAPLAAARAAALKGPARGLVFQLAEALGTLPRRLVDGPLASLDPPDRQALARLGIRFGVESVFVPDLLTPDCQRLAGVLWRVHNPALAERAGADAFGLPEPGRVCVAADPRTPEGYQAALGLRTVGGFAIRADMLERFAAGLRAHLREAAADGEPRALPMALLSMLGLSADDAARVIRGLGYDVTVGEGGLVVRRRRAGRHKPGKVVPAGRRRDADSPFAKLRQFTPN